MPVPRFVPIIAGGSDPFGGIAQQELAWSGFSAGREDANARRAQDAEQAQNNYLARLAQMQQEDAQRQDRLGMEDRRTAAGAFMEARKLAQSDRQFDTNVDLTKAGQALQAKMFEFNNKKQDQSKEENASYINDLGETMAPHVAEVGDAFEKSQAALQAADVAMRAGNSKWQAQLPGATWNAKTGQFEFRNALGHVVPPPDQYIEKAQEAAADMASILSGYDNAVRKSDTAKREWYALHNDLAKQGLPPIKQDGVWGLRSPLLKKTFIQMVKDAAQNIAGTPDAARDRALGFAAAQPDVSDVVGGGGGFVPVAPGDAAAPTVVAPPQASTPEGFVPQPSAVGNFLRGGARIAVNPIAATLRAGQYMMQNPGDVAGGLSPAGMVRAAAGPSAASGRIRVRAPDGRTGTISDDQIPMAISQGYELIEREP